MHEEKKGGHPRESKGRKSVKILYVDMMIRRWRKFIQDPIVGGTITFLI